MKRQRRVKPNFSDGYSFAHLSGLKDTLLSRSGCPWDREQTLASLKRYVLEEAKEVAQAIDSLLGVDRDVYRYLTMKKGRDFHFGRAGSAKTARGEASPFLRPSSRNSISASVRRLLPEELRNRQQEAIEELKLELGDLLLQPIFLAKLADKQGYFTLKDVIDGLYGKLVRRHPHVFGPKRLRTSESALRQWHELKRNEKI